MPIRPLLVSLAFSILAASAVVAHAAAPDLICEVRVASDTYLLRQAVSADPYAARAQAVGERFRFKAVVLGTPEQIDHITLTVYDLGTTPPDVVIQQTELLPPFNTHPVVPALTGWTHVYSSELGRELRYGCALRPANAFAQVQP